MNAPYPQPYVVRLRNTAEVINGITSQTGITVAALNSFLQLATVLLLWDFLQNIGDKCIYCNSCNCTFL